MARLTAASCETIFHRTSMMAAGTCSPAEYQRMIMEKAAALYLAIRFLPEVTVRAGAGVSIPTKPIDNHIGAEEFRKLAEE